MTLDETIKYCEEIAEENASLADRIEQLHLYGNAEGCRECASEHRQLAEWLKELKKYREIKNSRNRMFPNGEEVNADENSD